MMIHMNIVSVGVKKEGERFAYAAFCPILEVLFSDTP
jgi:hypothetical protein